MRVPTGYIAIFDTRAVTYDDRVVLTIEHTSRFTTTVVVFDRRTGRKVDYGFHNSPEEAFRFADAYMADGGADFANPQRRVSSRYSRAVKAVYA